MKTISVSKAKKKAWAAFSKWVRTKAADALGLVKCVTCQAVLPIELMQAGHFIPGRKNAILYDERGVHPQCYACNIILKGNPRKYDAFMRAKYGQAVIDELDRLSETTVQMKAFQHMAIYEKYTALLKELKQ